MTEHALIASYRERYDHISESLALADWVLDRICDVDGHEVETDFFREAEEYLTQLQGTFSRVFVALDKGEPITYLNEYRLIRPNLNLSEDERAANNRAVSLEEFTKAIDTEYPFVTDPELRTRILERPEFLLTTQIFIRYREIWENGGRVA